MMQKRKNVINLLIFCVLSIFTISEVNGQVKYINENIILDLSDVDKREIHSIKKLKSDQVFTYEKYPDKDVININIDIDGHGHLYFILIDKVNQSEIKEDFIEFITLNRFLYYFDSIFVRQNYEKAHLFSSRLYLLDYVFKNLYIKTLNEETGEVEYYKSDFVYTVST